MAHFAVEMNPLILKPSHIDITIIVNPCYHIYQQLLLKLQITFVGYHLHFFNFEH